MFYFLTVCGLALFDIVATHYQIIVYGTYAIESNPVMLWVMIQFGMFGAYLFRMLVPMICVPILLHIRWKHKTKLALWMLRCLVVGHIALACWHFHTTEFFTIHLG